MTQTYVSLDLETTGLDPETDGIIEIGAVKFRGTDVLGTYHSLVNPQRPLSYRVQLLCGIEQSQLDEAPAFSEVTGELGSFIEGHVVVGHNISFDIAFLESHGFSLPNDVYDTWELATILLSRQVDYSLASLALELDLTPPEHRALPDAIAAMELFLALRDRALQLELATLEELVRLSERADWKLGGFFRDVLKTRARTAFMPREENAATEDGEPRSPSGRREQADAAESERTPLDIESLTGLLEPDGLLAQGISGYEHRPGQIDMMRAVANALNSGEHLIVEAGTGTGKSIAYLLPSVVYSLQNGVPVVISTNTINLQEQLAGKDIPDLLRSLQGFPGVNVSDLKVVQLKGRSNYLCRRKYEALRAGHRLSLDDVKLLARLTVWVLSTETGDRAELRLGPNERTAWSKLCAQFDDRLEGQCPYRLRGTCYLYRARQAAESAHIIVVNHALLLSDMVASAKILPPHDHLIIDEAHHLEDETTDQLSVEVTQWDILSYLNQFKQDGAGEGRLGLLGWLEESLRPSTVPSSRQRQLNQSADAVRSRVDSARLLASAFLERARDFVEGYSEDQGAYDRHVLLTRDKRTLPGWSRVEVAGEDLGSALGEIVDGLDRLYLGLEDLADNKITGYDHLMLEISSLFGQGDELRQRVDSLVLNPSSESIYWLVLSQQTSAVGLDAAPLSVAHVLNDMLFSTKESIILTGATLSTQGSFEYIKGRLGLENLNELLLGPPFDYTESTLIYLPHDVPNPSTSQCQRALERMLIDLARVSRGRTLVLFTSHAALRATKAAIQGSLEEDGILVLAQGVDGSPRQLLAAFKANPESVLLGTASFWEGIDIVGDALSVLVIVRLPFNVPTEPVFAARSQLVDDSFNEYAVPQAAIRFKQGFGRLIRSKTDRGVVVVFDRRVQTRGYGAAFLDSIPQCTVVRGTSQDLPTVAAKWLMAKADA